MHTLDLRNQKKLEPKTLPSRKPYKTAAIVFSFALITLVVLNTVFAWTNPTLTPPGGGGALVVTAGAPSNSLVIGATGAITTGIWQAASIADAYLAGIAGSKVTGNILGNSANVTGTVGVVNGGTGGSDAATARTNLGLGSLSTLSSPLSVPNGGTGATTLSGVLIGNGVNPFTVVAPGASGNVLKSDGTNWTSGAASGGASWSQFTWVGVGTTDVGGTAYCTFSCPAGKVAWDYKGTVACPSVGTCFNNITWARTAWPDYWYATDYFGSAGATVGHSGGWTCTPQGSFLCGPQ